MESGFACQGCLVAIEEILHSNIDASILPQFYTVVEPILEYCFGHDGLDFMGEISSILNMFVFSLETLPEGLWSYFVITCHALIGKEPHLHPNFPSYATPKIKEIFHNMPDDDYACEFFNELTPVIRNFINKGDPAILTLRGFYDESLLSLLMNTIIGILKKNLPEEYSETESADALLLIDFVFAQLPGKINDFIPQFLDIQMEALNTKMSLVVKDSFIHNVGYALWNNTTLTLEYLNNKGLLQQTLTSWPAQHKKAACYRIRKASFIGLMSLYSLSIDQLKVANVPVLDIYRTMVDDLPELTRLQEKVLNAEFEDGDDDFDDFGDDDDEDDLVDVDLDKDEPEESIKQKQEGNQKLESKISKTQQKLEDMKDDDKFELNDAKEAFGEIENYTFSDHADSINEILLFESTLTSSFNVTLDLQTSNSLLYKELEAVTTEQMKMTIFETAAKVKEMIDSR